MKPQKMLMLFASMLFLISSTLVSRGQVPKGGKVYQDMSRAERLIFVAAEARRIAREMSGSEYQFTPAFESHIEKQVTNYTQRISNGSVDRSRKTDLRLVLGRAQANAPVLLAAFKARNVSPLIGLYLPWIESEYVNLESPGPVGTLGMFQFLPQTGAHYGLSAEELLDVGKSADAAARFIADNITAFRGDLMKEALALLAYNRGAQQTARDLRVVLNDENKRCSICALTAEAGKLDAGFGRESIAYVPLFFAAAIIGENPQAFGVQIQPISSH